MAVRVDRPSLPGMFARGVDLPKHQATRSFNRFCAPAQIDGCDQRHKGDALRQGSSAGAARLIAVSSRMSDMAGTITWRLHIYIEQQSASSTATGTDLEFGLHVKHMDLLTAGSVV